MRLLWVKMGGLWPLDTGGRRRSVGILAELARRHEVTVVTSCAPEAVAQETEGLSAHLGPHATVLAVPYQAPKVGTARFAGALARSWASHDPVDLWKWRARGVRARVAAALDNAPDDGGFDAVVADFLFAVPNVPRARGVRRVYFAHNVEHRIWQRICRLERRPWVRAVLEVEWRKVRRAEGRACREADVAIAVSENDRADLLALAPGARVEAIPTGVDVDYFRPHVEVEHPLRLVFSGSMDWFPNEDAAEWFVRDIWPRVRARFPEATCALVGRNPGPAVRRLGESPGVQVTGTVDDVRPWVAGGALSIVPLRIGGGTRLKILEALAMGRAVLSTTIGAEGLQLEPGRHVVLADTPEAFADAAAALLGDPERRRALGDAGRRLVEERFSWARIARAFERSALESGHVAHAAEHRPHLSRV